MAPIPTPNTPLGLRPRHVEFTETMFGHKGYRLTIHPVPPAPAPADQTPRYELIGHFGPMHALHQRTSKTTQPVPWDELWRVYASAVVERFAHGYVLAAPPQATAQAWMSRTAYSGAPNVTGIAALAATAEEFRALVQRFLQRRSPLSVESVGDLIRIATPEWRTGLRAEDLATLCQSTDAHIRTAAIQWMQAATAAVPRPSPAPRRARTRAH